MHYNVWDEITHPFANINCKTMYTQRFPLPLTRYIFSGSIGGYDKNQIRLVFVFKLAKSYH